MLFALLIINCIKSIQTFTITKNRPITSIKFISRIIYVIPNMILVCSKIIMLYRTWKFNPCIKTVLSSVYAVDDQQSEQLSLISNHYHWTLKINTIYANGNPGSGSKHAPQSTELMVNQPCCTGHGSLIPVLRLFYLPCL
jgi:hypothetical protein